ncbi:VOC family protein [Vibrio maerlii]|uniref:VOC family protein n=1 Tax=Vibrio maerlii TaxID=2231648 RepID=UPI000E3C0E0D|nr:VOC family protein [Vibrio maerlii]
MFTHVFLGTDDIEKSKKFYDAVMSVLGYGEGIIDDNRRIIYRTPTGVLGLTKPINGEDAHQGNGQTVGFAALSPEVVDKWHEVGLANGGTSIENPPGDRGNEDFKLYMAYLRDPSGNKICATHIYS